MKIIKTKQGYIRIDNQQINWQAILGTKDRGK